MVLAALVGIPLGALGGIAAGSFLFAGKFPERDYRPQLDQSADALDEVLMPEHEGEPVTGAKKALLRDLPPWLVNPSYQRTMFIDSILTTLWPQLGPAVYKEVVKQAKQPLADVKKQYPFIEDVSIEEFDLGALPFRLDSLRVLPTQEDELILETPLFWGGSLSVRVRAVLRAGPAALALPLRVSNVQFKALARLTIKPLVETLPCVGGITVSLMEEPHVDCEVRLGPSPDLMALPGVPEAVRLAIQLFLSKMLVYPNSLSVPIMPNFGIPAAPVGMLRIKVVSAADLPSSIWDEVDPFVTLEVRKGRPKTTRPVMNNRNPTWQEDFDFILDDPAQQQLKIKVSDFDLVSSDLVGVASVPLADAEFIRHPRRPVTLTIALGPPPKKNGVAAEAAEAGLKAGEACGKGIVGALGGVAGAATGVVGAAGGVVGLGSHDQKEGSTKPRPPSSSAEAEAEGSSTPRSPHEGGAAPGQGGVLQASPATSERQGSFFGGLFKKKKKRTPGEPTPPPSPGMPASPLSPGNGGGAGGELAPTKSKGLLGRLKDSTSRTLSAKPKDGKRPASDCGRLTLEVTFLPFKEAEAEGFAAPVAPPGGKPAAPPAAPGGKSIAQAAGRATMAVRRVQTFRPRGHLKGVLTMHIRNCTGLVEGANSFVTASLFDPEAHTRQQYDTGVVLNESGPRYDFKVDFVNIAATSVLTCAVYNRPELGSALGKSLGKVKSLLGGSSEPKLLGSIKIDTSEVVREGRIKDVWPLQEAECGEMHLVLEWKAIEFNEDALESDEE